MTKSSESLRMALDGQSAAPANTWREKYRSNALAMGVARAERIEALVMSSAPVSRRLRFIAIMTIREAEFEA